MTVDATLQRVWYDRRPRWLLILLLPMSALFALVAAVRRWGYWTGVFATQAASRPVIVIGNISVGGTGKTPLVMWLAERLQSQGRRVGIVTRGYGGTSTRWPREVTATTSPSEVGDEPAMMALRTGAIVIAGPDRVAAAELAISHGAEVILSDDGLQHYRLQRDAEIAVLDEQRGLGNGWLLPAGPLREPKSRLREIDLQVLTRRIDGQRAATAPAASVVATMRLREAVSLVSGERRDLASFIGSTVHALAAIGHPDAFFAALRLQGLQIVAHPLPDHAKLTAADLDFGDPAPVLMTEKDAVKCRPFATLRHWYVRMDLELSESDAARIDNVVDRALQRFQQAT